MSWLQVLELYYKQYESRASVMHHKKIRKFTAVVDFQKQIIGTRQLPSAHILVVVGSYTQIIRLVEEEALRGLRKCRPLKRPRRPRLIRVRVCISREASPTLLVFHLSLDWSYGQELGNSAM